jgi:thiosulfate reductase/polysulfide reductase chain A
MGSGLKPAINRRIACVRPRFDTKPMWWIVKELANRLGVGQYFPYETAEDIWNYQLSDLEGVIKIEDFDEKGFVSLSDKAIWWDRLDGIKFKTASGKIEVKSHLMESHGIPSLPPYEKLDVEPGAFRLMCGRCVAHTNVMTQNNPHLNYLVGENRLWINDNRAKELGIKDNDLIEVSSRAGTGQIRAFVTDMIHPEGAFMLHGFGHNEVESKRSYRKGVADALFQSRIYDKIGGSPALDHNWVTVKKV